MVSEIILAVKERNKQTRSTAFELLVQVGALEACCCRAWLAAAGESLPGLPRHPAARLPLALPCLNLPPPGCPPSHCR